MAVINHNECAVFICEIADSRKICNKTIHGEYAVGCNQLNTAILCGFELCAKIIHIVVLIAETVCLAETNTVNDACMVQFIGNNCIVLTEKSLKQTAVSIEAGRIKDAVIGTDEICKLTLKLLMNLLGAADESNGRKAEAPFIIACLSSSNHLGIVGKPKIVICAHIQNAICLGGVNACTLRSSDDSLILIGACFLN